MELLIATSNKNKVEQIQATLERPLRQIDIDLPEIQAIAVEEVIEEKAREAYRQVGQAVLVEDTGLYVDAWNGLPGAFVRWFLQSVGTEGICQMLADFEDLSARAETCIGFYDGDAFRSFLGSVEGSIAQSPRGEHGFGWDSLFIPAGSKKTFAEIPPTEKIWIDMRRIATMELKAYLEAG